MENKNKESTESMNSMNSMNSRDSRDTAGAAGTEAGREKTGGRKSKFLNILGTAVCLLLLPILIINLTLLFKGFTDRDRVPSFCGYLPMVVLSDSMQPGISSGDLILCRSTEPAEVRVGDVISFYDPDGNESSVVTHRVTEIAEKDGELCFQTKGDHNNAEDKSLVPAANLVGRYTGVSIPGLGSAVMFLQSNTGFAFCLLLPLFLFLIYDLVSRRRSEKKQAEESEALRAELERLRAQQGT